MVEWIVKKSKGQYQQVPLGEWGTDDFVNFYRDEYLKVHGVQTRRPIGQIKCHINRHSIVNIFRLEGRPKGLDPNELYREYILWLLRTFSKAKMKMSLLSSQETMVDFLDERAERLMDGKVGSIEEMEQQEKDKVKETEEYFRKLGMDI